MRRVVICGAMLAPTIYSMGAPDIYTVTVFDARGTIIYDFGGHVNDGEGDIIVIRH